MLNNIRAVAFDLDDTLWDIVPVIARAERRLLDWLREHCPRIPERLSIEDMRAARMRLAQEEPHNAHDFTYLRTRALERHARECGYDESIAHRAFEVFYAARNELDVFEDVRPALEQLRTRYTLATLSNGNADLKRIGLSSYFSVSLSARDVGVAKPHPRAFQALIEALQLSPSEILYVGDDPELDVAGACAAGLQVAWMNRRGDTWPDTLPPVPALRVRDCQDLVARLT
jgi:2-haloalkanoic acid dehalogenase type II